MTNPSAVAPAVMLAGLLCAGGCETKGFLDPAEMMRTSKEPLLVPVLNQLDPRDEPEPEFAYARDVRQSDLEVQNIDYVIGPNDLVNISITEVAGPSMESVKTARVSESGNVSLPLIGQIKASGRTEAELEKAIADEYRARNLIQNAQVSVTVLEARQRTFSMLGLVGRPGQFQIIQSDFRLLDALTMAGGTTVESIQYLYIIRKNKPSAGATTQPGATTRPSDGRPLDGRPGGDPLEGRPRGMLQPQPQGPARGPVNLMALQDPPAAGQRQDDTGERKVLIDGQWKSVKPGEKAQPTAAGAAAGAGAGAGAALGADAAETPRTDAVPAPGADTTGTGAAGTGTSAADGGFEFEGPRVDPDIEIIRVPIDRLQRGELQYNIVIRPNDLLIVPSPKIGEYYIGGHVGRPGVYSLTGRDITLKQAIISAGMIDPLGWPERTEVIRRVGKDRELFLRVNLPKIWAGEQSDFYLRPYDTVQVGTNAIAPFLAAIRGGFRISYGFGFIYDKNFNDENQQIR
jgi:protein involved in polysaccharide export with SLBB domain